MFFKDFDYATFEFNDRRYEIQNFTKVVANDPSFKFNSAFLQNYYIRSNMRPDIVADELYGNVGDWWVNMVLNGITMNDWPLGDRELDDFIDRNYSRFEQAKRVEYLEDKESDVQTPPAIWNDFKVGGNYIRYHKNFVTEKTGYAKISEGNVYRWGGDTRNKRQQLEYENEQKRFIRVIKPRYLAEFKRDFKNKVLGRVFV